MTTVLRHPSPGIQVLELTATEAVDLAGGFVGEDDAPVECVGYHSDAYRLENRRAEVEFLAAVRR